MQVFQSFVLAMVITLSYEWLVSGQISWQRLAIKSNKAQVQVSSPILTSELFRNCQNEYHSQQAINYYLITDSTQIKCLALFLGHLLYFQMPKIKGSHVNFVMLFKVHKERKICTFLVKIVVICRKH